MIDYRAERFEDVVHDADVVLDMIGGDTFERSWSVLRPGGFLVTTVASPPKDAAKAHGMRAKGILTRADGGELAKIAAIIDERRIKPVVTAVLPLSEAKRAREMSEGRHTRGKIVLRVAEDPEH